ncbi:hypothetical protein SOVF_004080 [Spinacia oleracea]|nr:hypothetical protein SOVF_004080 [Spinacia oleracea]
MLQSKRNKIMEWIVYYYGQTPCVIGRYPDKLRTCSSVLEVREHPRTSWNSTVALLISESDK